MNKFSIVHTNMVKGVALMLLLWHHLFYPGTNVEMWYEFCDIDAFIIKTIASMSKVCVATFLLLSGYGLVQSEQRSHKNVEGAFERIIKLLFEFWVIFVIFVPVGFFVGDKHPFDVYGTEIEGFKNFIVDFFGSANLANTPTYNPTWWFMGLILALYALFPILYYCIRKCPVGLIIVALFLNFADIKYELLPFVLGMYFGQRNIVQKYMEQAYWKKLLTVIISALIIPARFYFGMKMDGFLCVWILLFVTTFIATENIFGRALAFIGKHSSNIFMFHTFIFGIYFKAIIYWFKYPPIIFIVLLTACLIISIGIEKLKKVIGYNRLPQMVINYIKKEK